LREVQELDEDEISQGLEHACATLEMVLGSKRFAKDFPKITK
jgi:hypothetical protein